MPNFLDDYEPVEDRLRAFWQDNPGGRVVTVLIEHADGHYIVRAEVFRSGDPYPTSSGLAEESKSDRGVNATSALENCETSAIGRALANLGYAAKGKRPSREEMSKVSTSDPTDLTGDFRLPKALGAVAGGGTADSGHTSAPAQEPAPGTSSGAVTGGDPPSRRPAQEPAPGTTSVVQGEVAAATEPEGVRGASSPASTAPSGSTKDAPGPPHYPLRPDECDHLGKSGHILRPRKSPRGPVCPRCGLSYITITEGTNAGLGSA